MLYSVKFDSGGMEKIGEQDNASIWVTPAADVVTLHFFHKVPNLPVASSWDELKKVYKSKGEEGMKVVECVRGKIAGYSAIRLIVKIPQQPSGMTYIGSYTIPFENCSFVIRAQCMEHGTTGIREAMLLAGHAGIRSPQFDIDLNTGKIIGDWNPDDPKYDRDFPWHPVTRVRGLLARIEESLVLDEAVSRLKPWPLP